MKMRISSIIKKHTVYFLTIAFTYISAHGTEVINNDTIELETPQKEQTHYYTKSDNFKSDGPKKGRVYHYAKDDKPLETQKVKKYYYVTIESPISTIGYDLYKIDRSSPNFDLSFGRKFNNYYRLELSGGYTYITSKKRYRDSTTPYPGGGTVYIHDISGFAAQKYMINQYLDLPEIYKGFTPYMMIGAGFAYFKYFSNALSTRPGGSFFESLETPPFYRFASQLGIGLNIDMTKNSSLSIGVKHMNLGKFKRIYPATNSIRAIENQAHAGFTYKF